MCPIFAAAVPAAGAVHKTFLYLQRLLGLTFFIIYFLHTLQLNVELLQCEIREYFYVEFIIFSHFYGVMPRLCLYMDLNVKLLRNDKEEEERRL
jgi:predicted Na+-dependent transporter